jgi:hypothetical protein
VDIKLIREFLETFPVVGILCVWFIVTGVNWEKLHFDIIKFEWHSRFQQLSTANGRSYTCIEFCLASETSKTVYYLNSCVFTHELIVCIRLASLHNDFDLFS